MQLKRVVVTGLGALTPIGNSVQEYWANLAKGTSGAALIRQFDASLFKTHFACEVKNFDVEQFLERKEARKIDQFTQYALVAVMEAVENSQLLEGSPNLDRIGVVWGSGIGGLKTFQDEAQGFF
ncbi:MAG: beta-ketoacyl synthase N-terminal-like domain-containing protein, partial [Bacteroidota bacterium]